MRFSIFFIIFFMLACSKSENRSCLKSIGDNSEKIIALDSTTKFILKENITYRIYQDSLNIVKLIGGQNLLNSIDITTENFVTTISNTNKCRFLRGYRDKVIAEIHYSNFQNIYAEPTDSLSFIDEVSLKSLNLEIRDGGGFTDLNFRGEFLSIVVSNGVGNYRLRGFANQAEVKVQNNGYGNAEGFKANQLFLYQNSTADLYANIDSSSVYMVIDGTGNLFCTGNPLNSELVKSGDGEFILY